MAYRRRDDIKDTPENSPTTEISKLVCLYFLLYEFDHAGCCLFQCSCDGIVPFSSYGDGDSYHIWFSCEMALA